MRTEIIGIPQGRRFYLQAETSPLRERSIFYFYSKVYIFAPLGTLPAAFPDSRGLALRPLIIERYHRRGSSVEEVLDMNNLLTALATQTRYFGILHKKQSWFSS